MERTEGSSHWFFPQTTYFRFEGEAYVASGTSSAHYSSTVLFPVNENGNGNVR